MAGHPAGATVLAGCTVTMVMLLRTGGFGLFAAAAGRGGAHRRSRPGRRPGWPIEGWLLVACEVGQGDALVLSTGEPGTAIVVDTGPEPGLVDGCLARLGIGTIALLILTHLHADHVDGLPGALRRPRRRRDRGGTRTGTGLGLAGHQPAGGGSGGAGG